MLAGSTRDGFDSLDLSEFPGLTLLRPHATFSPSGGP